ncbi:hypothetical protein [Absidia glauca]|uniref:Uncharacterized protein n=1 Tax=Absidia glauca TaxID=4829 RepID=A0A163JME1_ABSGL|nr:hypothetical protein [Absidia glauca]
MFSNLLDQFRNNNDQQQDISPWLTAAATYLGTELLQHHGNNDNTEEGENGDHRSHFWRNAALSGALAYGLNKYQEHQQQQQQQQQQPAENYYYPSSSSSYYQYPSYYPQQAYYPQQPYYPGLTPHSYQAMGMNGMAVNPYLQQQQMGYPYSSFMLPYQQQTPYAYYYGGGLQMPPFYQPYPHHHHYSSFTPYHRPHPMIPYQRSLPYRYM